MVLNWQKFKEEKYNYRISQNMHSILSGYILEEKKTEIRPRPQHFHLPYLNSTTEP